MYNHGVDIVYKEEKLHIATNIRDSDPELIVFLHGLGCTKESFSDAWEVESLQAYSLLSIDFLGHGESSKPQDFSYSMEDHAAVISLLLQ